MYSSTSRPSAAKGSTASERAGESGRVDGGHAGCVSHTSATNWYPRRGTVAM